MSALAASTAIERGLFSSVSTAFWLAPRFRNRHTWLGHDRQTQDVISQQERACFTVTVLSALSVTITINLLVINVFFIELQQGACSTLRNEVTIDRTDQARQSDSP